MKKLCILILTLLCAAFAPSALAYTDVSEADSYCEAAERLSELGIINGYTDGSFRPYSSVTREEFAKMIVCAMDKKDDAQATSTETSKFYDVARGSWSIPYISYISEKGIIKGYVDGSFGPKNNINYAEAATILCRLLGYDEKSVGYYWPSNYISKANELGFNFGTGDYYAPLDRWVIAQMLDAAIFTDVNPNAEKSDTFNYQKDSIFLAAAGYSVLEDAVVLATPQTDDTLKSGEIKLSDGSVYLTKTPSQSYEDASYLKYAVIDDDGDICAAKGNAKGEAAKSELEKIGYSLLSECVIISTPSSDRGLSSNQIRTNYGVFKTDVSALLDCEGEIGTLLVSKDKRVISGSTHDANCDEYIVSEVNGTNIKYVFNNAVNTLSLSDDFPVYVDGGAKRSLADVTDDFVSGACLSIYTSNGSSFGVLEINSGYSVINDCFIIASKNEDKTLSADSVRTSSGTYKVRDSAVLSKTGTIGSLVLDSDNRIYEFASSDMFAESAGVSSISGNEIQYVTSNGARKSIKVDSGFTIFADYEKTTFAQAKDLITAGSDITFYGTENGSWEFAVLDTTNEVSPILASKDYTSSDTSIEGIEINKTNLTVYRNGSGASLSDIKENDVVYYNTKTNIMDVYSKKVTGIYYDAQPSKAYVSSVTVAGKTYEIGTTAAAGKLDASANAFDIGDKVTLLLGKNDKVVFVKSLSGFNAGDFGVVLSTSSRIKESGTDSGKSEYVATLLMSDGEEYDYVTDKNYSSLKGELVSISFKNQTASLSKISKPSNISGTLDPEKMTLGSYTLSDDIVIFQLLDNDSDKASVQTLNIKVIPKTEVGSATVLNAVKVNSFGDIGILYVDGLTDSAYTYGIMTSIVAPQGDSSMTTYNITVDGEKKTYTSDGYLKATAGPVMFRLSGGKVKEIKSLTSYASASSIDALDGTRIKLNGKTYNLDINTHIYLKDSAGNFQLISLDELEEMTVKSAVIYSDKRKTLNGDIKVIVVTKK